MGGVGRGRESDAWVQCTDFKVFKSQLLHIVALNCNLHKDADIWHQEMFYLNWTAIISNLIPEQDKLEGIDFWSHASACLIPKIIIII